MHGQYRDVVESLATNMGYLQRFYAACMLYMCSDPCVPTVHCRIDSSTYVDLVYVQAQWYLQTLSFTITTCTVSAYILLCVLYIY